MQEESGALDSARADAWISEQWIESDLTIPVPVLRFAPASFTFSRTDVTVIFGTNCITWLADSIWHGDTSIRLR